MKHQQRCQKDRDYENLEAHNEEQRIWRTKGGETHGQRDHAVVHMSDESPSAPNLPLGLEVDLAARLQLELIGTLVKAGNRLSLKKLMLASCVGDETTLNREGLRLLFKKRMNIEPLEEVLDALMQGKRRVDADDVMNMIAKDIQARELEAPFGNPDIDVPYGTIEDAARCIEETQSRMDTKWNALAQGFQQVAGTEKTVNYTQFCKALRLADRRYTMVDEEVERLFAEADVQGTGRVQWRTFMQTFGQGTQSMPFFMKPRYLRQCMEGRIWQWHSYEQGSNAHRKFEVIDQTGLKRYHCKSCHGYLLPKSFSDEAVRSKIHFCSNCMDAMKNGCVPGKHTQKLPPEQWPKADPATMRWKERLGNQTGAEVQKLRNRTDRGAPWAETLGVGVHNQYDRNNDFC